MIHISRGDIPHPSKVQDIIMMIFTSGHKRTDKHVDIVIISELSSDLQNDVAHFIPQFFMVFEYRPIYSI